MSTCYRIETQTDLNAPEEWILWEAGMKTLTEASDSLALARKHFGHNLLHLRLLKITSEVLLHDDH